MLALGRGRWAVFVQIILSLTSSFASISTGTSPGGSSGGRPPYPTYPQQGGASNPPYPVTQPNYPAATSTQSSYPPSYPAPVTRNNLVTTSDTTSTNNSLNDEAVKASLQSAVEDKLKRSTRALFEQAQVTAFTFT